MTDLPQTNDLHTAYCALSGLVVPLTIQRIFTWEAWSVRDGARTKADLELVVRYVKKAKAKFAGTMLRFDRLIGNTEFFDELKAEAEQANRVRTALNDPARRPRMDPARAETLRSAGRSGEVPPPDEKSLGQIMSKAEALKGWREMKEGLGMT